MEKKKTRVQVVLMAKIWERMLSLAISKLLKISDFKILLFKECGTAPVLKVCRKETPNRISRT